MAGRARRVTRPSFTSGVRPTAWAIDVSELRYTSQRGGTAANCTSSLGAGSRQTEKPFQHGHHAPADADVADAPIAHAQPDVHEALPLHLRALLADDARFPGGLHQQIGRAHV